MPGGRAVTLNEAMRVITVEPGVAGSARLEEVAAPEAGAGQVLVQVIEVGVDGTDREIYRGLCGEAPDGEDRLILGHECLGRVERISEGVHDLEVGDLVVATVRRPCAEGCPNCRRGASDMCSTGRYAERGIERLPGFMAEYYVEEPEYLVKVPAELAAVAVLLEPMSIVNKAITQAVQMQCRLVWEPRTALVLGAGQIGLLATMALRKLGIETFTVDRVGADHLKAAAVGTTGASYIPIQGGGLEQVRGPMGCSPDLIVEASGHSSFVFEAMRILGINGILAVVGASGERRSTPVAVNETVLELVLGNRTVFGCVNSNRTHFERSLQELPGVEREWPGLLASLITRRLRLEGFRDALEAEEADGIKTVLEVAQ
jgi:glucose 1-dehydrogenase